MLRKIVVFTVFKHENAAFRQQIVLENQVGNRRERRQLIGWVGENQVELPLRGLDESKNVFSNDDVALSLEFLGAIFDELHVLGIHFNAHHWVAAPRQHFKRDAARAGKQVERTDVVEIDVAVEYVEEVFLRKIGRRTRLERARNVEMATFVNSSDNAHNGQSSKRIFRSKGRLLALVSEVSGA